MVSVIFIFKYIVNDYTKKKKYNNISDMDMNTVVVEVEKQIDNKDKNGWWHKLLDKRNDEVSSSTFFVCILLGVGVLLLLVPLFALSIEAWFNHTITTDLTGMAAYIGSVTAIFTVAAGLKGWVSHNDAITKVAEINNECYEEVSE